MKMGDHYVTIQLELVTGAHLVGLGIYKPNYGKSQERQDPETIGSITLPGK